MKKALTKTAIRIALAIMLLIVTAMPAINDVTSTGPTNVYAAAKSVVKVYNGKYTAQAKIGKLPISAPVEVRYTIKEKNGKVIYKKVWVLNPCAGAKHIVKYSTYKKGAKHYLKVRGQAIIEGINISGKNVDRSGVQSVSINKTIRYK